MRKRKDLNENNSCASGGLVRIVNRVRKSICDQCMCGMRMREADRAGKVVPWKKRKYIDIYIQVRMHACVHGGMGNVEMHVWHVLECVMPAGTLPVYRFRQVSNMLQ